MKVYEFAYTDCIHESAKTVFAEREKYWKETKGNWVIKFGEHEAWGVYERDVVE